MKIQGRFKHLFKSDPEGVLDWHQEQIETRWDELLEKERASTAKAEAEQAAAPSA